MPNEAPTYWVEIAIAGSAARAIELCREFCEGGLCVTVTKTDFVYTGGLEAGVLVRLINYPRFPAENRQILWNAALLGEHLRRGLYQDSFSLVAPDVTYWKSRRDGGK